MLRVGQAGPGAGGLEVRSATKRRPRRRATLGLVLALVIALLPVPWLHAVGEDPPGGTWRLDGRLVVDGRIVDPPGRWSWLTVGRPPLVAEVARDWLIGADDRAQDLRQGTLASRPAVNEPVAAAVGLRAAGIEVPLGIVVEASGALIEGLPDPAVVTHLNGVALLQRGDLDRAVSLASDQTSFVTADAEQPLVVPGDALPYERLLVIEVAPGELTAAIGGPLDRLPPVRWLRKLALGRSHGLMVALVTYADAADADLARGRHVAGTGSIRGDGSVGPIGGLAAKATAARDRGADVLLFPAEQHGELDGFDPGTMRLLPVATLDAAIAALER